MEAQYDNEDTKPLTQEEVDKALATAVKRVLSRFYNYVEREDLKQVAELALLEHPKKFAQWQQKGEYLNIHSELHRICAKYAHKEKADKLGYRPEDLFFYSKKALREHIPAILESWETDDCFEFEYSDRAMWLDIEAALKSLEQYEYQILWWAFKGDPGDSSGVATVASHLNLSESAAASRIDRILNKLREQLGGDNPWHARKAKSNAAAVAELRNQWDGNG